MSSHSVSEWAWVDGPGATVGEEKIVGHLVLYADDFNEAVIAGTYAYYWEVSDRASNEKLDSGWARSHAAAKVEAAKAARRILREMSNATI
jgi:hypothetical protein